ncbi:hypothetical protein CLF_108429 [Clonorchis sinensis]|uniref:Uncharacterized protein n=1 Tax=Clonorchis sinensis TaxID=79923 RepID=G7YI17_CLOSI|nr:hypothetical protein CLF_108429 [Clonorchis sinensis]
MLAYQTVRNEHNGFVANTTTALRQCYTDEDPNCKPDQFRDKFKKALLDDQLRLATENKAWLLILDVNVPSCEDRPAQHLVYWSMDWFGGIVDMHRKGVADERLLHFTYSWTATTGPVARGITIIGTIGE